MELRNVQGAYEVGTAAEPAAELASWQMRRLHEIAEIRTGIAKNSAAEIADPVIVHYLRVANVQDGYLDLSEMKTLRVSRSDLSRYNVRPGDVLMNEGGDLDKLGRGAIWRGEYNPCVHQNHVFVVRCGAQVLPEFLNAWTAGADARRYFLLAGRQTTNLASINKTSLGELPVALPSVAEQKAIAKALSDTDALIESLEQLIAKKRLIKQGAMQELLTGKRRLLGFSGAWSKVRLGGVAEFFKGKGLPKSEIAASGTHPCIHYGELFTRYPEMIGNVLSRTASVSGAFMSQAGDVLMPTSDVTPTGLAKASCVGQEGVVLGGDILVVRMHDAGVDGVFLSYMIRSSEAKILQLVTGTTVFHLYGSDMAKFTFDAPAADEQKAIVKVLEDMGEEIKAIELKLEKTRLIKQAMTRELLTGRIRLA